MQLNPHITKSICFLGMLWLPGIGLAQDEEQHPVTIHVAGGFTSIVGSGAGKLDHGGTFQAGVGHFFNRYLGITGNFMFNGLGITRSQLDALGQPDGNARVYTLTADPVVRLSLGHGWSAYVTGGGGYMRRTVEFTQPTVIQTFIFDPWWGYAGPALIGANQILGSVTTNSAAVDAGGGVNIPLPNTQLHLFVETRFVHGYTSGSATSVVPIMLGIRW